MKRTIFFVTAICLLLVAGALSATEESAMTGWVSDESCGVQHTKPGGAGCIRKCMRGGADIGHPEWKPQRMVLVADKSTKIWVVENPDALKGLEGRHVQLTGERNAAKNSIRVTKSALVGDDEKK